MNAVEKIKAAAAELNADEQVELFRWWVESAGFTQRHLASLKREIAIGIVDLEGGRYQTYNDASVMQLAEDVGRSGKKRLTKARKHPKASYDAEADVLYINFKKPSHATDSEMTDDDVIVRYENGEMVGLTVLHASKR